MATKTTQKTKAKTTRELTEEIRLLNDENKTFRQKFQAMEEVLKKTIEKFNSLEKEVCQNRNNLEGSKTEIKYQCKECKNDFKNKTLLKNHIAKNHKRKYKCTQCGEIFDESWQLEVHLKLHEEIKTFDCEFCGKKFKMKWRLRKHVNLHNDPSAKKCHYYNNGKICPFEEIGCQFLHEASEM